MASRRKTKTICAVCNKEIEPTNDLLTKGCPYCGAFKFKTIIEKTKEEEIESEISMVVEQDLTSSEITEELESIRVTKQGIIEVDIQKLFEQVQEEEPLILRSNDGKYTIRLEKIEKSNESG